MEWLWKHKLVLLLGGAAILYFIYNPAGRIGIAHKGLIVYNKIPVAIFDCYIDPDGTLHLESDLSQPVNLKYWFEQHFLTYKNEDLDQIVLLIGTGFNDGTRLKPDFKLLNRCKERGFAPNVMPSQEAIEAFNTLREQQKKCALLLRIK
jgi:hypothetical protein